MGQRGCQTVIHLDHCLAASYYFRKGSIELETDACEERPVGYLIS